MEEHVETETDVLLVAQVGSREAARASQLNPSASARPHSRAIWTLMTGVQKAAREGRSMSGSSSSRSISAGK